MISTIQYTCDIYGRDESDEDGYGVCWQLCLDPVKEPLQVELGDILHDGGHPRLPLEAGDVDTVDDAVGLLEDGADHALNLDGRNVLSAPSKQSVLRSRYNQNLARTALGL